MKIFRKILSALIVMAALDLPLVLASYKLFPERMPENGAYFRIMTVWWIISLLLTIYVNIFPNLTWKKRTTLRIKLLEDGVFLLQLFLFTIVSQLVLFLLFLWFGSKRMSPLFLPQDNALLSSVMVIGYVLLWIVVLSVLFWNGIIRVYATSVQLGIKWRLIGIACGLIPIVHLYVLINIIKKAGNEVIYESEKYLLDQTRAENLSCKTKYPILLVHGVFFRDFRFFNYWGRIPAVLKRNGAELYYGGQQSAASVAKCGAELSARIRELVETTGCGKVNIIAHSKGGLDSRYAISAAGAAPYTASLTTINTPHRGCIFADYLLQHIPDKVCQSVAGKYNATLKKLGDHDPDFLEAVQDLTASACTERNEHLADSPLVYYQSVGSRMNRAASGRFPLNMSYPLVKHFDGANDGLVSLESAGWGSNFISLSVPKGRGISHGDMIDLNRENIPGFDVREFYVGLVRELKEKGY